MIARKPVHAEIEALIEKGRQSRAEFGNKPLSEQVRILTAMDKVKSALKDLADETARRRRKRKKKR